MTIAHMPGLREKIMAILREKRIPLRTPEIELQLKVQGNWDADTFDVRDAVQALITEGKVSFEHPGYLVRLTESE